MFRKLKKEFAKLNLTQQLVGLLVMILTGLFVISVFIVPQNINTFVDREMYSIMQRSQTSVIYRYRMANYYEDSTLFDYIDPNISHYIVNTKTDKLLFSNVEFPKKNELKITMELAKSQLHKSEAYEIDDFSINALYYITEIEPTIYIITSVSKQFRNDFHHILIELIVFIVSITMLIVFLFFLVWISSVINPLNRLVRYIKQLGKDKKEKVEIDLIRQDEIGDVARSIVEMERMILKQEKLKMEMIHNISHDLKTPITTIKTYGESIKDGIYPYETLAKSIDVIIENANRLERKAHSLLLLNQLDAIKDNPPIKNPIAIKEVANRVLLSLKVVRPEIKIITKIDDVIYVGDEESWRICLENLMDNALRYAKSVIEIIINANELVIYNDGSHLSQDRIDKLFKPYEKGTDGQFGLGLSIVYRICLRMGYHISGSNERDGVVFRIVPMEH